MKTKNVMKMKGYRGKSVGLTVKTAIKAGGFKTCNHNPTLIGL